MSKSVPRYENLDYLRGLCALSIMCYHYIGWTIGGQDSGTVLGRLGVYGVSMFYVLSGLTMYLVYFSKFDLIKEFFSSFYLKRFFRIYPLMWLVMAFSLFADPVYLSPRELLENFTGAFSVVHWNATLPLGMWSIGNELAFYLMLPIIFYCLKKGTITTLMISSVIFGLYCYFAFILFDIAKPVSGQDSLYKNPLNQAGLFLGGILIGHLAKPYHFNKNAMYALLLLSLAAFVLYPAAGNTINIVAGINRIAFTLICFLITFAFFKSDLSFIPSFVAKSLSWLGEISYSLYLIHGLVFSSLSSTGMKIRYVFPLAVIITFILSWIIFRLYETPARNIGVRLSKKKQNITES